MEPEELQKQLKELLHPQPSEQFVSRVMAKVEALPRRKPWGLTVPQWLYPEIGIALAACLLLIFNFLTSFLNTTVSPETILLNGQPKEVRWASLGEGEGIDTLWEDA